MQHYTCNSIPATLYMQHYTCNIILETLYLQHYYYYYYYYVFECIHFLNDTQQIVYNNMHNNMHQLRIITYLEYHNIINLN